MEGERALMAIFEPWCRVLMQAVDYPETISGWDAVPPSKPLSPDEKVENDMMFLMMVVLEI